MKLSDLQYVDKDTFIEYFNRCMLLNMNPCDDAIFEVSKYKNIILTAKIDSENIRIPDFVSTVRKLNTKSSFMHLKNIDLNNTISLMDDSLRGVSCTGLESEKLRFIGSNSFIFSLLESVYLPSVQIIGRYAFYHCFKLKTVYIPHVNYISNGAFSLSNLEELVINRKTHLYHDSGITDSTRLIFLEDELD